MHPPRPTQSPQDLSWRDRLSGLRNVRPLLRMVWETSPPLVLATVVLRLLRALLPLAMLWVSKLILDAVVARISRGSGDLRHVWNLVALELGLAVLSDVLGRANTLCDSLLGDRFTNRVSVRLMEHATALDLASFEDPGVLRQAGAGSPPDDRPHGTAGGSAERLPGHPEPDLALGRADRLFAVADGAAGRRGGAGIPGGDPLHDAGLFGALPLDSPAPPPGLPADAGCQRPKRQGDQDLRTGQPPV